MRVFTFFQERPRELLLVYGLESDTFETAPRKTLCCGISVQIIQHDRPAYTLNHADGAYRTTIKRFKTTDVCDDRRAPYFSREILTLMVFLRYSTNGFREYIYIYISDGQYNSLSML